GIGVGTLIRAAKVVFLGGYAFGCHSLRHLAGGCFDQLSTRPLHERAYACVSCLNRRHGTFAWLSLFSVAFADLYIRLCSMGGWPSCTRRKRRRGCASWRPGARSSTAPRTAASSSATSAATVTRDSRTWAIAPGWR